MHKHAFTGTMAWTHSHDINLVKKNTLKLAKIAKALDMPVVLTSCMEDRVDFTGPLMLELEQILPEAFAARLRCTTKDSIRPSRRLAARSCS